MTTAPVWHTSRCQICDHNGRAFRLGGVDRGAILCDEHLVEFDNWTYAHPAWRVLAHMEIEVNIARMKLQNFYSPEIEAYYRDTAHSFLRLRDDCHCAASVWLYAERAKFQEALAAQEKN